jgi:hypothetical protein
VGVYQDPERIRRLELQLKTMGYRTQTQEVLMASGNTYRKLFVVGLGSQAEAEQAIRRIGKSLNIAATLATAPPAQVGVQ